MAKKEEFKSSKSRVTVTMFHLEGNDQTVQEGIRTIGQALSNFLKPSPILLANTRPVLSSPVDEPAPGPIVEEPIVVDDEEENNGDNEQEGSRAPRRLKSPKILDLNIKGAKSPLKEFCESRSVGENDTKRYLTITHWLKVELGIQAVTMDHIHTCYRFLGWLTPKDASMPLRNLKNRGSLHKATEKGAYTINHVGENEVMEMAQQRQT